MQAHHLPATPAPGTAKQGLLERMTRQETRHVMEHGGRRLVWRRFGSGPPLVLVHGGHGDWRHWLRNIEALAAAHTLWLPDLPGFGESDNLDIAPHAPERMDALLAAVQASLDTLVGAQTPIAVAGFSFGGLIAAQLAARRPVHKLALLGPAGHAGLRRQTVPLLDWRQATPEARRSALRQNLAAFMLHGPEAVDELALDLYAAQCEATRFRSKAISRAGGLPEALDRYGGPVMLVWGEHDVTAVPDEAAPHLAAGRAERHWRIVPDAGHWVQYERPDEVSALLMAWFGAGGQASRA